MLDADELADMANDIRERGLLQPIVLDKDGRLLDGRNRSAACKMAEVEPTFTTYDGDDTDGYALAVNIARRHLTKGQQAMVTAKAVQFLDSGTVRKTAVQNDVSKSRISQARVVLDHAPDLVGAVIAGAMGLDEAYKVARERKTSADSVEAQLTRLRGEDPELANRVVEGDLTLAGAWAERRERAAEEQRQRRVATHLLCQHVVTVAQLLGGDTRDFYDPAEALPGRAVTRALIEDAKAALDEMLATWNERNLP